MNTDSIIQITNKQSQIKQILDISYAEDLGHIPSALSLLGVLDYLSKIFTDKDKLFIGKPYGAQAYEVMRSFFPEGTFPRRLGSVMFGKSRLTISTDNSLGHTLSRAIGYAYANPQEDVYVIMGDAGCLEGCFLEAISAMEDMSLPNLILLIDLNQMGVTSKIKSPFQIKYILKACGWNLKGRDGKNPSAILFYGAKGAGIPFMENDATWHYKKLNQQTYKEALLAL